MPSKCVFVFHLTFCPVYHVLDLLFLSDAQAGLYNDVNLNLNLNLARGRDSSLAK